MLFRSMSNVGEVDDMATNALKILSDDKTLQDFRQAALTQAKAFDIHHIMPIYEKYYEQIIQSAKK